MRRRRSIPDILYPLGIFIILLVLVGLLWAVGDGIGPGTWANEVTAARYLLVQEKHTHNPEQLQSIESALRTLDPEAIERAEQIRSKEARRTDGQ